MPNKGLLKININALHWLGLLAWSKMQMLFPLCEFWGRGRCLALFIIFNSTAISALCNCASSNPLLWMGDRARLRVKRKRKKEGKKYMSAIISPLHRRGNWGSWGLSDLPKVTVISRARIKIEVRLIDSRAPEICLLRIVSHHLCNTYYVLW